MDAERKKEMEKKKDEKEVKNTMRKKVSFTTKTGKKVTFTAGKKKRKGKRKISMKAVRAAIASSRTPARLKEGLKKKYGKRLGLKGRTKTKKRRRR